MCILFPGCRSMQNGVMPPSLLGPVCPPSTPIHPHAPFFASFQPPALGHQKLTFLGQGRGWISPPQASAHFCTSSAYSQGGANMPCSKQGMGSKSPDTHTSADKPWRPLWRLPFRTASGLLRNFHLNAVTVVCSKQKTAAFDFLLLCGK